MDRTTRQVQKLYPWSDPNTGQKRLGSVTSYKEQETVC